jgi:hypothetical protein
MLEQPYAGICFRAQRRTIIHHKTKRERSTMGKKIVTITVLELIAELGKFPLDAPILLTSDEKGSVFFGLQNLELAESGSVILWPSSPPKDSEI